MISVVFRPAAAADVEDAYEWYESQRPDLGEEFLAEVSAAVELIVEAPQAFAEVHRSTRRALLRRFPYGLFYRVVGDEAVVVACMHCTRSPRRWEGR